LQEQTLAQAQQSMNANVQAYQNQPPQISSKELYLWKRQAQAIGRSQTHLQAINRLLQLHELGQSDFLDITERSFQVYCLDVDEFNRQALRLMESTNPLNQAHRQLAFLGQKVAVWWRTSLYTLQRFWNRTYKRIKDQYLAHKRR
jgi:hypothetical protein